MISLSQKRFVNIRDKINLLLNYLIIAYAFIIPFEYTITKEIVKVMIVLWILSFDYKRFEYIKKIIKNNKVFQLIVSLIFLDSAN